MVYTGSTFHSLLYIHEDEKSSSEKGFLLTAEQLLYCLTEDTHFVVS